MNSTFPNETNSINQSTKQNAIRVDSVRSSNQSKFEETCFKVKDDRFIIDDYALANKSQQITNLALTNEQLKFLSNAYTHQKNPTPFTINAYAEICGVPVKLINVNFLNF